MSAPSPAGAANGCIARRRSSPGSGVRDSRKRTETGGEERRRGQSPGLAARAKRERRARERAGAAGTNSRRARETRLQPKLPRGLQLDASRQPRSRTAAPLYRAGSLQRYASGTVPPCAILCTLGGSSELLLGHQCPLFLFFPGQFCGAPQLLPQIIIILILT